MLACIPRAGAGADHQLDRPVDVRDTEGIVRMLRATSIFAPISKADLELIATRCTINSLSQGEALFRQGDIGTYACLVLHGNVSIEVEDDRGDRVTVAVISAGEIVGEIGAFASVPRMATVRAQTEVRLLRIEQSLVRRLLDGNPDTAIAIIADLGRRLQNLNSTIATLTRATDALAAGEFDPAILDSMRKQADQFSHFADVFEHMANEMVTKRAFAIEMRTAAEIQLAMLPPGGPCSPLPGVTIAAQMVPALRVGGDFYDYFPIDGTRLAIAIGDVSGKGVPAALFMSIAKTALRAAARVGGSVAEVLARANATLCEDNSEAMFVTVALAVIDTASGETEVASGGHEEIYLVDLGGVVRKIDPMGPALGLFVDAHFRSLRVRRSPGEWIVLATDGVTEAFSAEREVFGNERLERQIAAFADATPGEMIAGISKTIRDFAEGMAQSDDLTGIAMRFDGYSAADEGQPVHPT